MCKVINFFLMFSFGVWLGNMAGNDLQLGEVTEIVAQMFSFAQNLIEELVLNLVLNPPFAKMLL
ncbi:hypothetical protein [Chryseobacterium binzhouense]|uniref:hypothetical protein n=1 Tax=Chryseobacterium binzhouense TaxID=2593646 RepID=UPI00117C2553|nr:hypothetical protein [Chryseobacterium binzhouense]